jgi:hypothetical protein
MEPVAVTAFVPISPAAALELLEGIGVPNKEAALASYVEGGIIKAYAQVTVTIDGRGGRAEVRDRRIDVETWSRIIDQDMICDVWSTGSARLAGDGITGGRPTVQIVGIRFDEKAVRDVVIKHSAKPVVTPAPLPKATKAAATPPIVSPSAPDAPPLIEAAVSAPPLSMVKRGLAPDELCVSVTEAMEIIGISRTTIYKLRDQGKLIMTKIGGRTMVDASSIRNLTSAAA